MSPPAERQGQGRRDHGVGGGAPTASAPGTPGHRAARPASKIQHGATPWPADQPERRAVASLRPFPRNARLHSPEQVLQIRQAIDHWGWTMPVLIDETGEIIAGHGRVLAAQLDPPIAEVPVLVARGWSDEQVRAYRLADNKLSLNASWSDELLKLEIGDLKELGADIGLTGFSDGDLATLFLEREDGETDPNAEWQDMPAFAAADRRGLMVKVHFDNETDKQAFEKLLGQRIPTNVNAIWYPYKARANLKSQEWKGEEAAAE